LSESFFKIPKIFLIISVFALCNSTISSKNYSAISSDSINEIFIIGTVHYDTENFNSDTLLKIFNLINPDVILVEADSSYFTSAFELNDDVSNEFLETTAITEYKINHKVILRPYDISGRDSFMNDNIRMKTKSNLFKQINALRNSDANYDKLIEFEKFIELAEEMSNSTATYINSNEGSIGIDSLNYLFYYGIEKMTNTFPELSDYKSFWKEEIDYWNKRNNVMLENISEIANIYKASRIVVLCGFAHKNFIKKGLKEKNKNLIVKEYWEI